MKAVYEHGATTHHEIANLRRELAELKARVAALESATPKPTDDGDLNIAANEIKRLEAELAAANAKIEAARESDRIDLLLALGIESPKPTDNSESDPEC